MRIISPKEIRVAQTIQETFREPMHQAQENRRRWLMLFVLLLATFMCFLDLFIVNVAVPSIEGEFHASFATSQLVIAGYILGYAVLLATGGRLGDLFGRKKLFLLGVMGFTLCSTLCGLAPTTFFLILFRLTQGGFAALITPPGNRNPTSPFSC